MLMLLIFRTLTGQRRSGDAPAIAFFLNHMWAEDSNDFHFHLNAAPDIGFALNANSIDGELAIPESAKFTRKWLNKIHDGDIDKNATAYSMMFIPNHSEQHKDIMQHTIYPPEEVIDELIKSWDSPNN
jgi:hypothetical protein